MILQQPQSTDAPAPPAAKAIFEPLLGRSSEYDRAKKILNAGRHPTFVGRDTVCRNALQGGLIFAAIDDADAGVAVVNVRTSTLLVLCVHPKYRKAGLGAALLEFLRPNFARVVESAVPWFARNGYIQLGDYKQGRSLRTAIMVRGGLTELCGRLATIYAAGCACSLTHTNETPAAKT